MPRVERKHPDPEKLLLESVQFPGQRLNLTLDPARLERRKAKARKELERLSREEVDEWYRITDEHFRRRND